jgi:hypothetical protein
MDCQPQLRDACAPSDGQEVATCAYGFIVDFIEEIDFLKPE